MMRAKYLYEWFPPIIEEELTKVTVKEILSEFEADALKDEIGTMLFGELYDITGVGNHNMTSRNAGYMGAEVKKWRDHLTTKELTVDDL